MQKLLEHLSSEKLILLKSHPDDARATLVVLSARGQRLMVAAQHHLAAIEAEVESRIGVAQLELLRKAMAHDWAAMFR
jgi:DNA-binding MarR family transcriptional regulator